MYLTDPFKTDDILSINEFPVFVPSVGSVKAPDKSPLNALEN